MSTTTLADDPPVDLSRLTDQDKKDLIISDSVSITSATTLGASDLPFTPAKSVLINTRGIAVIRLPTPPSQLETTIHDLDGSIVYKSTRAKRNSGSCVLADADGTERISTTYYFGPGKEPVLNRLDGTSQDIKTMSKWTSRAQSFLLADSRTLTWSYKREKNFGANGTKGTALVLTLGEKRLAALIRNDEMRTPGSRSCSAGNGGELMLGEEVDGVGEDLVVATCLLMLKKEVDRRRTMQMLVLAGAISG